MYSVRAFCKMERLGTFKRNNYIKPTMCHEYEKEILVSLAWPANVLQVWLLVLAILCPRVDSRYALSVGWF